MTAPVAQLDRVLGYEPRGRAFESLRARQKFQNYPRSFKGPIQKWIGPLFVATWWYRVASNLSSAVILEFTVKRHELATQLVLRIEVNHRQGQFVRFTYLDRCREARPENG